MSLPILLLFGLSHPGIKSIFLLWSSGRLEMSLQVLNVIQRALRLAPTLMITSRFAATVLHSLQSYSPQRQGHVVTNVTRGQSWV